MSFELLEPKVKRLIEERFDQPTEAQKKAIPKITEGKNTLLIAPTGLGKTEAAILPVLSELVNQESEPIQMLYITPLKALNRDLVDRITSWTEELGITCEVRHGDTSRSQRSKQAKNPPQILITTPETLQNILPAKKMGKHLSNVSKVVVDEIHELAESKRGLQLSIALERLQKRAQEVQRIGLSATVGTPDETAKFLAGTDRDYKVVDVTFAREIDLSVESPSAQEQDRKDSKKLHLDPEAISRLRRLHELVEEHESVLTFVNTRQMAELLGSRYSAWDSQHGIKVHHSSLSKDTRVLAEEEFKEKKIKGVICTSSLELGIDIGSIDLVAQYTSPRQVNRLLQRVGRSGHGLGRVPKGVVICSNPEDIAEATVVCNKGKENELEAIELRKRALDVLAHQLVGISLDLGRVTKDSVYELVKKAYPFAELIRKDFDDTLEQMESERFVWIDGNTYRRSKKAFKYYYGSVSMIPAKEKFFVNSTSGESVGTLDEAFVAEYLRPGKIFITKGRPWKVVDIREKKVLVEPSTDISAAIPDWAGEELPVPFDIAQEVGELRKKLAEGKKIDESVLQPDAARKLKESVEKQLEHGFMPDHETIFLETFQNTVVMHAHFGTKTNITLSKLLSSLLTSFLGQAISATADPYRIIFQFPAKTRPDLLKKHLEDLEPDAVRPVLDRTLSRSSLFKWKFLHVARRFSLIGKKSNYKKFRIRSLINAVIDSPIHKETLNSIYHQKMNIEKTKEILERIHAQEIKIKEKKTAQPSTFASFSRKGKDLFVPEKPTAKILELVKSRILDKKQGFKCINCGHKWYKKLEELEDKVKCPECGGKMVTFLKASKKKKVASLIKSYGKRAVWALNAHGVGPVTATRLLKNLREDEKDFFKDLVKAERQYIKTKHYWKDKE